MGTGYHDEFIKQFFYRPYTILVIPFGKFGREQTDSFGA